MSFSLGDNKNSVKNSKYGGYYYSRNHRPISEINVTPFVDVMLVLLVVFMIAAPMLIAGIPLELPKTNSSPLKPPNEKPVTISITSDGRIYVDEQEVAIVDLADKVMEFQDKKEKIYIRADNKIFYGKVLEVMAELRSAGLRKIGLISDIKQDE